jgi:hypothetical protein
MSVGLCTCMTCGYCGVGRASCRCLPSVDPEHPASSDANLEAHGPVGPSAKMAEENEATPEELAAAHLSDLKMPSQDRPRRSLLDVLLRRGRV